MGMGGGEGAAKIGWLRPCRKERSPAGLIPVGTVGTRGPGVGTSPEQSFFGGQGAMGRVLAGAEHPRNASCCPESPGQGEEARPCEIGLKSSPKRGCLRAASSAGPQVAAGRSGVPAGMERSARVLRHGKASGAREADFFF